MDQIIPAILFAITASITPGPNNFMLLNAGLHFGIRRSLGLYLGIVIGFPVMVLIIALGFGEIFIQYPIIEKILKILGAAYMFYLAYRILTSHTKIKEGRDTKPLGFFHALALQWVNPKAWIMTIGAIALFSLSDNPVHNSIFLSLLFFVINLPSLALWLCFGHFLQRVLKEPKHRLWFNIIMAAALAVSVLMIFVE